jgi:hypothetical protein
MLIRSTVTGFFACVLCGCGASSGSASDAPGGGFSGTPGFGATSGAAGSGGTGNTNGSGGAGNSFGGGVAGGFSSGGTAGTSPDSGCRGIDSAGEQVPLDMFVMFDQSLSMNCEVSGSTRWEAVKSALEGFVNDSGAGGIGDQSRDPPSTKIPTLPRDGSTLPVSSGQAAPRSASGRLFHGNRSRSDRSREPPGAHLRPRLRSTSKPYS